MTHMTDKNLIEKCCEHYSKEVLRVARGGGGRLIQAERLFAEAKLTYFNFRTFFETFLSPDAIAALVVDYQFTVRFENHHGKPMCDIMGAPERWHGSIKYLLREFLNERAYGCRRTIGDDLPKRSPIY